MNATTVMTLQHVNVGKPTELIDHERGRSVLSGIGKHDVALPTVMVHETNISGDGQADLKNHGGVDKAVYTYSHDHLPDWQAEISYGVGSDAPFGENLSVSGLTEDDVYIGDHWQWGDVVLEIAQPRWPCSKLGLHSGHRDLPVRLIDTERSGWYSRVVSTGEAPTSGPLKCIHRDERNVTVREAFRAAKRLIDPHRALQIASHPKLAASWRHMILKRYQKTEIGS